MLPRLVTLALTACYSAVELNAHIYPNTQETSMLFPRPCFAAGLAFSLFVELTSPHLELTPHIEPCMPVVFMVEPRHNVFVVSVLGSSHTLEISGVSVSWRSCP